MMQDLIAEPFFHVVSAQEPARSYSGCFRITTIAIFFLQFCASVEAAAKARSWLGPTSFSTPAPPSRQLHGFTSIDDRLFLFGGSNASGAQNDFHYYDVAAQAWTQLTGSTLGTTPAARTIFPLAAANGRVYLFGGKSKLGARLNDFYCFDPALLAWQDLTAVARGTPPSPRSGHGLVFAAGWLYVFGGYDGAYHNDLYGFDPVALRWADLSAASPAAAPTPRLYHGIEAVGRWIYVFGGLSEDGMVNDLHRFDTSTLVWTDLSTQVSGSAIPVPRYAFGFAAVNGLLYVFGGFYEDGLLNDLFVLDPSTLAWTDLTNTVQGSIPPLVDTMGFTAASDGKMYLFGGGIEEGLLSDLYQFDPTTAAWAVLSGQLHGEPPSPRSNAGVAVADDMLFVFGGTTDSGLPSNDLYTYNPLKFVWSEVSYRFQSVSPPARNFFGFASTGDHLYLFGGSINAVMLNEMHRFDVSLLRWSNLSGQVQGYSPPARHMHGFTSEGGMLYCFGGISDTGYLDELLIFDPSTLAWTDLTGRTSGSLPTPRHSLGFASSEGMLYVFGGYDDYGILNDFYSLDPLTLLWTDLSFPLGFAPAPRASLGFTAANGKLFIFGGYQGTWEFAVYSGDSILMLDPQASAWSDITSKINGHRPRSRYANGLVSYAGKLYIFGGINDEGTLLSDLTGLAAPGRLAWQENRGADFLINVFDWDELLLQVDVTMRLAWQLSLCIGIFPCALSIVGTGGAIVRTGNGGISCISDSGCTKVSVQSVNVVCERGLDSSISFLEVGGSELDIAESSFAGCVSRSDGTIIHAHSDAKVTIDSSNFKDITSFGYGGVLRAVGGTLRVTGSTFAHCSSSLGGGAISISTAFCSCALLAAVPITDAYLDSCTFSNCTSGTAGGAMQIVGEHVNAEVSSSIFSTCSADSTGGAISVKGGSLLTVTGSTFASNVAHGAGGGALEAQNASITLEGLECNGNTALDGGGGVLYWSGIFPPIITYWCGAGSFGLYWAGCSTSWCMPNCMLCGAGKYQTGEGKTECLTCPAGKYSTAVGATAPSTCSSCGAGTYSTTVGSKNSTACILCGIGTRSGSGASACSLCAAGKYSSGYGAALCVNCDAGTFSSRTGALDSSVCVKCTPGKYAISGATRCSNCVIGKYSNISGAVAVSACTVCVAGKFSSSLASSACSVCQPGTYSSNKFFTYQFGSLTWDDAKAACLASGGNLASVETPAETREIVNLIENLGQNDFWLGYHYDMGAGRWTWTDGSMATYFNWADANPKQGSKKFGCVAFPSYTVNTQNTTGNVVLWPYFREQYGIIPNSPSYSISPGDWYNYDCENGNGWINTYICSFRASTTCHSCTEGKFSTSAGASSKDVCMSCPAGKFSSIAGSSACSNCSSALSSLSGQTVCGNETAHRRLLSVSGETTSITNTAQDLEVYDSAMVGHSKDLKKNRARGAAGLSDHYRDSPGYLSRARSNQQKIRSQPNAPDAETSRKKICGQGNAAGFGDCLASAFVRLEVSGLPTIASPAYPGLEFAVIVAKKDAYNQTVVSDSSSVLQAASALPSSENFPVDSSVTVSAASIAIFQNGRARLPVVLKPTFTLVVPDVGTTQLYHDPYLYVKGLDAQEAVATVMQSNIFAVLMASGQAVCPPGFILSLDDSRNRSARPGSCSRCGVGTYSVSPLAGYTAQVPSCLNCPAGAISGGCPGGNTVMFSLGKWIVSEGQYKLVACPSGHQLLNSANGFFSHDIQVCVACQPNQYILDSNMSNFSCQTCPVGAVCDGTHLRGAVEGSVWVADFLKGLYTLKSCPVGYELLAASQDAQQCGLCASGFYCTGGSSPKTACPYGTFSTPGANSSTSCVGVVFVEVSVSVPMTKDEFTGEKQRAFQNALASAAGVSTDQIIIKSVTQLRRDARASNDLKSVKGNLSFDLVTQPLRRLATMSKEELSVLKIAVEYLLQVQHEGESEGESVQTHSSVSTGRTLRDLSWRAGKSAIQVVSTVATRDESAAAAVTSTLTPTSLNSKLAAAGLPPATLDAVSVQSVTTKSSDGAPVPLIVGVSVGGFVFFWILIMGGSFLWVQLNKHTARIAFLSACRTAKPGDKATAKNLPFQLRRSCAPQTVIGRGAFGCVVHVKQGNRPLAIKFIVPEKGRFSEREMRQLSREAQVLDMYTTHRCEHAVQLSGTEAVRIKPDLCWFVMEYVQGQDMETVITDAAHGPISDVECIQVARNVLAALKVIHAEGIVHRDIKPANIMRSRVELPGKAWDGTSYTYKLIDFGTALGVDETVAKEAMMTLSSNRQMGAGTLPYMSPEMFKEPEKALYPTDIWSLGVTMFELVTGSLPFAAESDLLLGLAIAGNMDQQAPNVLDKLGEHRRANFDHNLSKAIAKALEKHVDERFQSVDEMHEALYCCLIFRNEAFYSVFISYRVASEAPFARLLFDDLNHSVTPGGHRVTVYWDTHRLVKGKDWEESFSTGLLHSLCLFPLLSYGSTAPLAEFPVEMGPSLILKGWEEKPCGRTRLAGTNNDPEDNVLKEFLIASSLLERRQQLENNAAVRDENEKGLLHLIYPILIGRQHPKGHPNYPRMGSFFDVQGGGGKYPEQSSPPTSRSVYRFLKDVARLPEAVLVGLSKSVASVMQGLMALQGCQMWDHPSGLTPQELTREQKDLIGKGCAGPPVDLDGINLTLEQKELCRHGFDEEQLRMLKAQIHHKRSFFHEIIDRAVTAHAHDQGEVIEGGAGSGQHRRSGNSWAPVLGTTGSIVRGGTGGSRSPHPSGGNRPPHPSLNATAASAAPSTQAVELSSAIGFVAE